ncbi:MAG TPA: hypothetical protein VFT82_00095 [Candidatus Paceibacterota bacterium]|nr:hypothetical protein [Candidatus Paceibacterota bacterium]
MIEILKKVESSLPALLADQSAWKGIYADSEKPHLSRLWRQWGEYRINLHHFTECEAIEEFPHPHPWQMAVRILEGNYLMGLGKGSNPDIPPALCYQEYKPGDCYEMLDADEWHAIRPLGGEALTIMVSGPPIYEVNKSRSNKPSRELSPEERQRLFERIRVHYPLKH